MILSLIVAVSDNQVIGVDNKLPWHLPIDLKYFKSLTSGHAIIMGRKTYESIGKPLPNRENIVITRSKSFQAEGIIVKHSIEEAIDFCKEKDEVFIIGGDTIYTQTLIMADKIYLTRVHISVENGTAFFPEIRSNEWQLVSQELHNRDEKNLMDCTFEVYHRMRS